MPSTSRFVRSELLIPDALPRFSARFNPAVLPPSNGFTAVQMDRITKLEPPLRRHGHSNIQVEDDRSPIASVHLCHTASAR